MPSFKTKNIRRISDSQNLLWLTLVTLSLLISLLVFVVDVKVIGELSSSHDYDHYFETLSNYLQPSGGSDKTTGVKRHRQYDPSLIRQHKRKDISEVDEYNYELNSESIVLITGAAGFIGSQLAVSLYRVYGITNIICVDHFSRDSLKKSFAEFDVKRQRMNYVIQNVPNVKFYAADFRPTLPEFYEVGEVPILENWFQGQNITHVVHLADDFNTWRRGSVVVPHGINDRKSGSIEVLFEQLNRQGQLTGRVPHFTYASSFEVYDTRKLDQGFDETSIYLKETDILTNPMSIHGTQKLIDEIIASSYYSINGVTSVGLRLFPVYGPWDFESTLSEMASNVVRHPGTPLLESDEYLSKFDYDTLMDFVYIDDCIEAILSAMQFACDSPSVFNVGTGEPISLYEIADFMSRHSPELHKIEKMGRRWLGKIFSASLEIISKNLNWAPRTSVEEGLSRLISWHNDRENLYKNNFSNKMTTSSSVLNCLPFDTECLQGYTVLPCISECSNPQLCHDTPYDEVAKVSTKLTSGCKFIFYTITLGLDISNLPDFGHKGNDTSHRYDCYIAFVSERDFIQERYSSNQNWKQVVVPIDDVNSPFAFIPKYSPRSFFAETVREAIYIAPSISPKDLPLLYKEVHYARVRDDESITVIAVPSKEVDSHYMSRDSVQEHSYNRIKITMRDLFNAHSEVSNEWIIHPLRSKGSHAFRCIWHAECSRWSSCNADDTSLNFILPYYDAWFKVFEKSSEPKTDKSKHVSYRDVDFATGQPSQVKILLYGES